MNLEELCGAYLSKCYEKWPNFEKVSQMAQCDRRTVKTKIQHYQDSHQNPLGPR